MSLSEKREARATLVAALEQASGGRVSVQPIGEDETLVVIEGGHVSLVTLRAKASPVAVLDLALEIVEKGKP
jgi:hypothetical protein